MTNPAMWDWFPDCSYILCLDCKEYTNRKSVQVNAFLAKHSLCSRTQYAKGHPEQEGWKAILTWDECLTLPSEEPQETEHEHKGDESIR